MEKFGLQTRPVPLCSTAARTRSISPNQPVVPTTTGHAERREALDILDRRGGSRELDGHIDAAEILARDAREIHVVELVQLQRDGEAVLGRQLLDQPAHLSVADDGEVHAQSNTAGSSSRKNSSCRLRTACFRSSSATTS